MTFVKSELEKNDIIFRKSFSTQITCYRVIQCLKTAFVGPNNISIIDHKSIMDEVGESTVGGGGCSSLLTRVVKYSLVKRVR